MVKNNKNTFLLKSVAYSDVGLERKENQDCYCVLENKNYSLYAVADGMGGTRGGGVASQLTIKTIKEYIQNKNNIDDSIFREAIKKANEEVYKKSLENPAYKGMGTTFSALGFSNNKLFIANVGDSRAYRFRENRLERLTEDHTFGNILKQTGVANKKKENPISLLLYLSIGPSEKIKPDCWLSTDPPKKNDLYLICSDGLYSHLRDYEIAQILRTFPLKKMGRRLIEIANKRGGKDNITVIVISVKNNNKSFIDKYIRNKKIKLKNLLTLTAGIILGVLLSYIAFPIIKIKDQETYNLKPITLFNDETVNIKKVDIENITKKDKQESLSLLQKELDKKRKEIEIETRRLSIWHKRHEIFFKDDNINPLISKVSITSSKVKIALKEFRECNLTYLENAEKLIYAPANLKQEKLVKELAKKRKEKLEKLNLITESVINNEVNKSLYKLRALSSERDKVQKAIKSINEKMK